MVSNPCYLNVDRIWTVISWKDKLSEYHLLCTSSGRNSWLLSLCSFFLEMTFFLMEIWGYDFVNTMRYKGSTWVLFIQVMGWRVVISPLCKASMLLTCVLQVSNILPNWEWLGHLVTSLLLLKEPGYSTQLALPRGSWKVGVTCDGQGCSWLWNCSCRLFGGAHNCLTMNNFIAR